MPSPPSKSARSTSPDAAWIGASPASSAISPTSPAGVPSSGASPLASVLRNFPTPLVWPAGTGSSQAVVAECLLVLNQAFPSMTLSPELAWHFLQDLDERALRQAVADLIQTKHEVYPSTNWIAELREAVKAQPRPREPHRDPFQTPEERAWSRRYDELHGPDWKRRQAGDVD